MVGEYAPGMRVYIRDEEWLVRKVEKNSSKRTTLHCIGISTLVRDRETKFLADLENVRRVDPLDTRFIADETSQYMAGGLFLESAWRQKQPMDHYIHMGGRAVMNLLPYQLEPAFKALQRPRKRILIADAVGLGKTLEAGILMSELIARGNGKRILVVTAKSMMKQFQKEMWNRFTIPLTRLDSTRIHRLRSELPTNCNPFFYHNRVIISIDTLKRDLEYRTYLENAYWDIIVIDEAQNVAERGNFPAQRARLAKLLANRSDSMIMLSATPHDGKAKSFASLMEILDPTAVVNPEKYTREDIQGLCIRRFKKDVRNQISGVFLEREVHIQECTASEKEEDVFEYFSGMRLQMDLKRSAGQGQLFKTSLEKALFSSPAACIKSIRERLSRLRKKYTSEQIADIQVLERLKELAEQILPEDFSRYQKLLELLRSREYEWDPKNPRDRLVIFTERIETMNFLRENLMRDLKLKESQIAAISGVLSDSEQQKIVEDFGRLESPVRILVASDVASEGLNLHYLSHRLIHFDIPWSLMVFQQRNGRIDRYGQEERPDIRYLKIRSRNQKIHGDVRIFEILIEKERQACENLGDPAQIMAKYSVEEEENTISGIIENGADLQELDACLGASEDEFDPFEALLKGDPVQEVGAQDLVRHGETLFADQEYLERSLQMLKIPYAPLMETRGLHIDLTPEMLLRLQKMVPEDVFRLLSEKRFLRLSPDRDFCMQEINRSRTSRMETSLWPMTQYLWPLHPIFAWIHDRNRLLFGRGEAPILGASALQKNEFLFLLSGSIPNRRSAPLVDEWFGILFRDGEFIWTKEMRAAVDYAGLRQRTSNTGAITGEDIEQAQMLLRPAIERAKEHLDGFFQEYNTRMTEKINEEMERIVRHGEERKALIAQDNERRKDEETRKNEKTFNDFAEWVRETLYIENNPYLKVIGVVKGV